MIFSKQIFGDCNCVSVCHPVFLPACRRCCRAEPEERERETQGMRGGEEKVVWFDPLTLFILSFFSLSFYFPFFFVSHSVRYCYIRDRYHSVCVRAYIESENPWAQPLMNSHFPLRQTHSSSTCRRNDSFTEWLTQVNCSPLPKPPF